MSSELRLKNSGGSTLAITHSDSKGGKTIIGTDIVTSVATINDFPTVGIQEGDTVIVKEEGRGGTFILKYGGNIGLANDGTIFVAADPFYYWHRQYSGAVNVKWFDLTGTVTEVTVNIQNAISLGKDIDFGDSVIEINNSLEVVEKQRLFSNGCEITNNVVGSGIFHYTTDTDTIDKVMPSIEGFVLNADYPIVFNDFNLTIMDGITFNNPSGMFLKIHNCYLNPLVNGRGYGISLSRQFNAEITGCQIRHFDIGILLNGCVSVMVERNRIMYGHTHNILNLMAGVYGNNSVIRNNNILYSGSTSNIMVKDTTKKVSIYDNFLEANLTEEGVGAIDISNVDTIEIGPSENRTSLSDRRSTFVKNNTVRRMDRLSEFIYRYNPFSQVSGVFQDNGADKFASINSVILVDDSDNIIDYLPHYHLADDSSIAVKPSFMFDGQVFGGLNGFMTSERHSYKFDTNNYTQSTIGGIQANDYQNYLFSTGDYLVSKTGFTAKGYFRFPANKGLFPYSTAVTVTIYVKMSTGTETIQIGRVVGATKDTETNHVATEQYSKITKVITSQSAPIPPATEAEFGIYFERPNDVGADLHILSVEFSY